MRARTGGNGVNHRANARVLLRKSPPNATSATKPIASHALEPVRRGLRRRASGLPEPRRRVRRLGQAVEKVAPAASAGAADRGHSRASAAPARRSKGGVCCVSWRQLALLIEAHPRGSAAVVGARRMAGPPAPAGRLAQGSAAAAIRGQPLASGALRGAEGSGASAPVSARSGPKRLGGPRRAPPGGRGDGGG